ncbi:MAG: hypothetical protein ABH857_01420 [Elusimicrobiota bacterium]
MKKNIQIFLLITLCANTLFSAPLTTGISMPAQSGADIINYASVSQRVNFDIVQTMQNADVCATGLLQNFENVSIKAKPVKTQKNDKNPVFRAIPIIKESIKKGAKKTIKSKTKPVNKGVLNKAIITNNNNNNNGTAQNCARQGARSVRTHTPGMVSRNDDGEADPAPLFVVLGLDPRIFERIIFNEDSCFRRNDYYLYHPEFSSGSIKNEHLTKMLNQVQHDNIYIWGHSSRQDLGLGRSVPTQALKTITIVI